jgi:YfiR/HmsC-like
MARPHWRRFIGVGAVAALSAAASGLGESPLEYQVKAAYLYNFAKFVDWPATSADAGKPFVIGVLGRDPFGRVLDETVEGKTVRGRAVAVRRVASPAEARECDEIFIGEIRHLPEILQALRGRSVLIVGETVDFVLEGGMIGLVKEDNKVRFEVNTTAAEKARLRVSSQLLRLARRVAKD